MNLYCSKCGEQLDATDIKGYLAAETATEIQLACQCGATFYAFVEHKDWTEAENHTPVDLSSKPNKQVKLTAKEKRALAAVGEGCDVINPMLAATLRAIQKRSPDLIWIGDAMGVYPAGAHHPYFGAKLTAAGKAAIAPAKKGGAA